MDTTFLTYIYTLYQSITTDSNVDVLMLTLNTLTVEGNESVLQRQNPFDFY